MRPVQRPAASVVICAYTMARWPLLERAIITVLGQLRLDDELIVVADHNEVLHQRVRQQFAGVWAIENFGEPGLSDGRNSAIAVASNAIIVFLDDDACPEEGWLEELVEPFAERQVLGVMGAILPDWESRRRPAWFPPEFDWVVGCSYRGLAAGPVRNLIGANMAFRADVFRRAGGFHNAMGRIGTRPMGCEETELCIRAGRAEPTGRFVAIADGAVLHWVPRERTRLGYFLSRCYGEGLSKAAVARLAGASAGLGSERRYTARVLPLGVLRGLGDVLRARPAGLLRAAAIVGGLAATTAGYLRGRLSAPPLAVTAPAAAMFGEGGRADAYAST